jgi:hypothetical protein
MGVWRHGVWFLSGVAAAAVAAAPALAEPVFEVQATLRSPAGEAWKGQTITAPVEVPATAEFQRADQAYRLAVAVGASQDDCHPVFILLEPIAAGIGQRVPSVMTVQACEGITVQVDGRELGGAPTLRFTIKRVDR